MRLQEVRSELSLQRGLEFISPCRKVVVQTSLVVFCVLYDSETGRPSRLLMPPLRGPCSGGSGSQRGSERTTDAAIVSAARLISLVP